MFKNDPVLRQALNLAVNKQAMINSLVGGVGKIMNSPFPDNLKPWYDTNLPAWKYDVAKANQMLTSDGWKMTKSGVREKDGRMLEFTLSTTSGDPQRSAEEEQLQHDWAQVGAKVTNFTNFPADQFFGDFGENGTMATGTVRRRDLHRRVRGGPRLLVDARHPLAAPQRRQPGRPTGVV